MVLSPDNISRRDEKSEDSLPLLPRPAVRVVAVVADAVFVVPREFPAADPAAPALEPLPLQDSDDLVRDPAFYG